MIEKCLLQSTSKQTFNKLTHISATTPPALTLSLKKQKQKTKKRNKTHLVTPQVKVRITIITLAKTLCLKETCPKNKRKKRNPKFNKIRGPFTLQRGPRPDLTQKFYIIITPNGVPDSRWGTVECKPCSAPLWTPAKQLASVVGWWSVNTLFASVNSPKQ